MVHIAHVYGDGDVRHAVLVAAPAHLRHVDLGLPDGLDDVAQDPGAIEAEHFDLHGVLEVARRPPTEFDEARRVLAGDVGAVLAMYGDPRPRVINPTISSPGMGLQQRLRRTRTLSTPGTTTPCVLETRPRAGVATALRASCWTKALPTSAWAVSALAAAPPPSAFLLRGGRGRRKGSCLRSRRRREGLPRSRSGGG